MRARSSCWVTRSVKLITAHLPGKPAPAAGVCLPKFRAASSRSRTSWSPTSSKRRYQRPTAAKYAGVKGAHHFIHLGPYLGAGFRRAHRDRRHHPGGPLLPDRPYRRHQRGTRGKPVVDHDRRAVFERRGRALAAIRTLTPRQFPGLLRCNHVDGIRARMEELDNVRVKDTHATGGDGAQRQLFMPRHAELADDQAVQGRVQRPCDLEGNGDAATRQAKDQQIAPVLIVG